VHLAANIGDAKINVTQGQHDFQTRVVLDSNTTVDIASGATLEFNHRLNLGGSTLTKVGAGSLLVNNNVTTGGGTIIGTSGVIGGGGVVSDDLTNLSATVAPGNSPGILSVSGNYTQGGLASILHQAATLVKLPGKFPSRRRSSCVPSG